MKKNNNTKFTFNFKYLMLIPIILVLFSIVLGVIFNLNYDYDFRKVSNFSVKFNTTVTDKEYDILEDNIIEILKENDIRDFRVERIGSGAKNAVLIKIANDESKLDEKIENVKIIIEENLLSMSNGIESSVVVSLSDTDYTLPKNVSNLLLMSVISVILITIFVFAYTAIRYNLMAGNALIMSIILDIIMLFASMVTFRIPFNYYFVVPFIVMILTTIINATYMNNYIKSTLNLESYSKFTNAQRVEETTQKSFKGICIYIGMIALLVFAVMFFGGPTLIYLGLAILVGLIISLFVSLLVYPTIWSMIYKKDNDKRLLKRIEAEKQKELNKNNKTNKDDEKIVV